MKPLFRTIKSYSHDCGFDKTETHVYFGGDSRKYTHQQTKLRKEVRLFDFPTTVELEKVLENNKLDQYKWSSLTVLLNALTNGVQTTVSGIFKDYLEQSINNILHENEFSCKVFIKSNNQTNYKKCNLVWIFKSVFPIHTEVLEQLERTVKEQTDIAKFVLSNYQQMAPLTQRRHLSVEHANHSLGDVWLLRSTTMDTLAVVRLSTSVRVVLLPDLTDTASGIEINKRIKRFIHDCYGGLVGPVFVKTTNKFRIL